MHSQTLSHLVGSMLTNKWTCYTPHASRWAPANEPFIKDHLKPKGKTAQSLEHYITGVKRQVSMVGTWTKPNMDLQYVVQIEKSDTEGGSKRQGKRGTMWQRLFAVTDVSTDWHARSIGQGLWQSWVVGSGQQADFLHSRQDRSVREQGCAHAADVSRLQTGGHCLRGEEWLYFRRPSLIFMWRINSVCSWVGTPVMESSLCAAAGRSGPRPSHPQWAFLLPVPPLPLCPVLLPQNYPPALVPVCWPTWHTPPGWLQCTVCTLNL